jgi:2-polyprenyl-6-methoxyphenol hydroxylase-like FAD-dependent oxidoreductase
MEGGTNVKCRQVAIVGSGMAGLVTAYLLNQDPERRYNVEVFEIVRLRSDLFSDIDRSVNAVP